MEEGTEGSLQKRWEAAFVHCSAECATVGVGPVAILYKLFFFLILCSTYRFS
jgi:hypothetical protein